MKALKLYLWWKQNILLAKTDLLKEYLNMILRLLVARKEANFGI